ncbi:HAD family hydrolase [Rickettsiella endosymbiont of Xylota segnis]|uniref:HAD family hydrolase n=1 Tax=Rickettsiella endosymbiont of Xylota segnis TaxID=3066238 RepID=UPI0030D57D97
MKKKLFVFDFDGTIVSGHTHNEIIKEKRANPDAPEYVNGDWAVVQGFPIIGSMDTWKNIFEDINQQGHYVAINSFNSFAPIIPKFLEKIGLDEDFIKEDIHIIAKFPANPAKENKNAYIQESIAKTIEKSGEKKIFSGNAEDVFLIDDSKKNIDAAKQAGYQVIHAKKDGSHLTELQNKLEELKKLEEQPPVVDRNAKPKQLSESEQLKQQREVLESERIEKINQLKNKELSSQEKSILSSELNGIELTLKAKYDRLAELEKEKLAAPIVDSNKPKHVESIPKSTKEQGAVSKEVTKQSPQPTPLEQKLNIPKLMEAKRKEVIKFWNTPLEEINKTPTTDKQLQQISTTPAVDHKLKEEESLKKLLKAPPKNANRLKDSTDQQSAVSNNIFRNELEKKLQERQKKQAMQGTSTSTLFSSVNSSTSRDNTKTQEKTKTKTASKQFS